MFLSEVTLIFSNLLTNAVKAANSNGRIRAHGWAEADGSTMLRIENTGVVVKPDEGEKWFSPFVSTTIETDPILGQGMGMGLPITRNMLEEYGATIKFAKPSRGYVACIEIRFAK
jgi:signal transduction histidine kinase